MACNPLEVGGALTDVSLLVLPGAGGRGWWAQPPGSERAARRRAREGPTAARWWCVEASGMLSPPR
ncbi:hypothetical protein FTX61_14315 [Nitriliruptoraceae bacterium ZYF776]|nr:hypothetical protein [Profundirhabdus halotolerans]